MKAHAPARRPWWGPRRERLLFFLALACIVVWGFSGSWELPSPEPPERATVPVVPAESTDPAARGEQLFADNGCYACHSISGETKIGPSLLGIYGETVELAGGDSTVVDDAYLLESILAPQAKLVAGFEEAAMPSYEGLVSESDAEALAAYIKSLD